MAKISIKVVSQQGFCAAGHKVGDQWIVDGMGTPEGICVSAFSALYPSLRVLMVGGTHPWESDPDATMVACPDPANPIAFELRRLPE